MDSYSGRFMKTQEVIVGGQAPQQCQPVVVTQPRWQQLSLLDPVEHIDSLLERVEQLALARQKLDARMDYLLDELRLFSRRPSPGVPMQC